MIWDFEDGTAYESAYSVSEYDCDDIDKDDLNKIVNLIQDEFPAAVVLPRDPVADYLRMHQEAAANLDATDRARVAFLQSAQERVQSMGKGVLIAVQHHGHPLRIVVTQNSISILRNKGNEQPALEESLAKRIAEKIGGVARKLVY